MGDGEGNIPVGVGLGWELVRKDDSSFFASSSFLGEMDQAGRGGLREGEDAKDDVDEVSDLYLFDGKGEEGVMVQEGEEGEEEEEEGR